MTVIFYLLFNFLNENYDLVCHHLFYVIIMNNILPNVYFCHNYYFFYVII